MFISLRDLQRQENQLEFHEEWQPNAIDIGPDLRQTKPLKSDGRATLVEEHHGHRGKILDIRVAGKLLTALEMDCARCLEPVQREVDREFDLLYRPLGVDAGEHEKGVTSAAEADVGYYEGDGILLEDVLREQMILALPMRTVCREDCKGLCPKCGENLNADQCHCEPVVEDPRWSALKDLKLKDSSQ